MRKRRMPPPTFALQRLRGASLRSLARKYCVSPKTAHMWEWDALRSRRKFIQPVGLCRALAEWIDEDPPADAGLCWFAKYALIGLRDPDAVDAANRDHAYAMLKGGHLMMTYPPGSPWMIQDARRPAQREYELEAAFIGSAFLHHAA